LAGQAAHVRAKLTNHRADTTQYPARGQELPAVYTNGPYWRLMTYTGSQPFSGEALAQIVKPAGEPGPWTHWNATERWSALVDDSGWGLGVWNPDTTRHGGGFAGKPGAGGAHDSPTGYIAPLRAEILDHDIEYSYQFALVLGTLDEIRGWVARQPRPAALPHWTFDRTRAGWTYTNATDTGLPIRGKLEVQLDHDDPQLVGPPTFWRAADAPIVEITVDSNFDEPVKAQLFFSTLDRPGFLAEQVVDFELGGRTEKPATYRVRLADAPGYRGAITQLRFDPIPRGKPGGKIDVYSIRLLGP
jgi:hypothetical protein